MERGPSLRVAEADDVDAVRAGWAPSSDRLLLEPGELAGRAARHPQVVHQVVAERAARVGEAAGVLRVSELSRMRDRLERLRAQHHGAAADLARLARHAVDVEQAGGAVGARVRQHLVDHRVGDVACSCRSRRASATVVNAELK